MFPDPGLIFDFQRLQNPIFEGNGAILNFSVLVCYGFRISIGSRLVFHGRKNQAVSCLIF